MQFRKDEACQTEMPVLARHIGLQLKRTFSHFKSIFYHFMRPDLVKRDFRPFLCEKKTTNMVNKIVTNAMNKKMMCVFSALCMMFLSSCKDEKTSETHTACEVMTVATGSVEIKESYSASIQGRQDIDIYPQVSGRIVKLCITEGQQVHKGQLLFIIDQVPYQAAWQKAKADVRAAEAQAKTARLEWESKKQLFSKQVVSEYDLTTAQNALDMAEATLEQMKALELNARNNLSYTEVRSPADGVTGTLPYREGTLVSSSMSTPLTTISDNSEMYVYFSMTENSLRALFRQYGSSDGIIRQMPPLSLMLNDGTLYTCHGRIESISGVINRQTGTVSVRSAFPNPDRLLLSGGIGNIILPHKEAQAIVIPQTATTELQDKILAYKVATDAHSGKATVTSVELTVEKLNDGKTYIVRSGLNAGDVIVTEGAGLLRDGMQIKVKNSKTGKEN